MSGKVKYKPIASKNKYAELMKINGDHPFKNTWPLGYIEYEARARKNGKVLWFNFDLAKEMGLIPASHTNEINKALSNQLIDTFALTIINEWDLVNKKKFEQKKLVGIWLPDICRCSIPEMMVILRGTVGVFGMVLSVIRGYVGILLRVELAQLVCLPLQRIIIGFIAQVIRRFHTDVVFQTSMKE